MIRTVISTTFFEAWNATIDHDGAPAAPLYLDYAWNPNFVSPVCARVEEHPEQPLLNTN